MSSRLRILFLTHRLPYAPNRGDRIRAYHELRLLSRHHDVDLVSLVHDRDEASHVGELRGIVKSATGVQVNGLARKMAGALSLATARPLTHVLLHSRGMRPALRRHLAATRPDVVFAYCTGMARYAMEPPLMGAPWILDMVDVDSAKWADLSRTGRQPLRGIYRREARLLRNFERVAVERAAATTVISRKEQLLLEQIAPGCRSDVVGNGIDLTTFAPPSGPADTFDVVFCGVFNYAPNEAGALWLAKEVWPHVSRAEPRARLILVGMHPTRAVSSLTAESSIRVTGAVPDVRPFLWESAVSVAPLFLARGLQNKVLEALAAGLPCVVTTAVVDGLPKSVHPGCAVADEPREFANAIVERLGFAPDARRRLAGLADLGQLSWNEQLAPILRLVEEAPRRAHI